MFKKSTYRSCIHAQLDRQIDFLHRFDPLVEKTYSGVPLASEGHAPRTRINACCHSRPTSCEPEDACRVGGASASADDKVAAGTCSWSEVAAMAGAMRLPKGGMRACCTCLRAKSRRARPDGSGL